MATSEPQQAQTDQYGEVVRFFNDGAITAAVPVTVQRDEVLLDLEAGPGFGALVTHFAGDRDLGFTINPYSDQEGIRRQLFAGMRVEERRLDSWNDIISPSGKDLDRLKAQVDLRGTYLLLTALDAYAKASAVSAILAGNLSRAKAAELLGVHQVTVGKWVKESQAILDNSAK